MVVDLLGRCDGSVVGIRGIKTNESMREKEREVSGVYMSNIGKIKLI